jgi:ligand-binding sensor domain-containing protein
MRNFRNIILALLAILIFSTVYGQSTQIRFEHLDDRDGLSHNRVTSVYKDDLGFIWFGTLSGVNRFDGHEIQILRHEDDDPYAMHNSNVIWIKEGPGKRIWIKSSYGVFAYDIFKEKYVDISSFLEVLNVDNYNLRTIIRDQQDSYWFLVDGFGISKYDSKQDSLYQVRIDPYRVASSIQLDPFGNLVSIYQDGIVEIIDVNTNKVEHQFSYPEQLKNNPDLKVLVDSDGGYWFYSTEFPVGVHYLDLRKSKHRVLDEEFIGSRLVSGIIENQDGSMIIGMDHFGLSILNKTDWTIEQYRHNPSDTKSLSHNTVICLYKDYEGMVWIGTNKGGINYFSPKNIGFRFYKQSGNVNLYDNDILQIVQGKDKNHLWLGTDGGGLLEFNISKGKFKTIGKKGQVGQISSNIIVSMTKDMQGGLWIGTYLGGLNYYDGREFKLYTHDENDANSISDNSIWKLFIDSKNRLWIGSLKNGVDVYDQNFNKVFRFCRQGGQIHSNYVTAFEEDSQGRIWIGTGYGVDIFDPADSSFTHILRDETNPESLSNNSVVTMHMDTKGHMWIGTMHGLNRITIADGSLQSFSILDGLPHDIVTSIAEDKEGNMWFGTYKGLSKMMMDSSEVLFENFNVSDGLQGEMFNERSVAALPSGELAFGGKNGLNVFDPLQITNDKQLDKLLFVDFFISNHQIKPGEEYNGRVWFEDGINQMDELELKHFENSFSFGFTALRYYQQHDARFKFRLLGFDSTWVS